MNLISTRKYNSYSFMIIGNVSTINYIDHIHSYSSDTLKSGSSDSQMDSDWLSIILKL